VTAQSPTRFSGKSDQGYFAVTLTGNEVLSEEGFEQPF